MLKKWLSVCVVSSLMAHSVYAFSNFQVQGIQFEGLTHVSESTVRNDLPITLGESLTPERSDQIIKALYQTGFFSDIKLYQAPHQVLEIHVQERPTIGSIHITGNKIIKKNALDQVLQGIGLETGYFFDPTLLSQMIQSLKEEYYSQGKYSVIITPTVTTLPRNRVSIDIKIAEGTDTDLHRITLVGNHAFSESTLLKQLTLQTPHLLSFFTQDDVFSTEKLQASLMALQSYYMDRGYINFQVDSSQVSLDPYKVKSYLTINLTEGAVYTFSGFSFSGNLILTQAVLEKLVDFHAGEVFSRKEVLAASKAITRALGNQGYGFAEVNPMPHLNSQNHTVSIEFNIQPHQRVYIHHINFVGNTVSDDQALRQYVTYQEAGLFNSTALSQSLIALERLPYLQTVKQKVVKVPGSTDLANIEYDLKERSASTLTGSIGYSQLDKIMFGITLGLPNVFGTGKSMSVSTQLSKPYKTLNISYTNPFFTASGIQQTITAYLTRVDNGEQNLVDFSTNSVGGTMTYAFPLDATDFFNLGGGFDNTQLLQPQDDESETVNQFVAENGNNYNTFSTTIGVSRNSTNNAYFPTKGVKASLSSEIAVPGSKFTWTKLMGSYTWYRALNQTFTLTAGGDANYGFGYGKTDELPFIDNFYAGGWGSVRGYSDGTLGPLDTICTPSGSTCTDSAGQPLGGNLEVDGSLNLLFPVPFDRDNQSMRFGVFLDAGNAYNTYNSSTIWDHDSNPRYPSFSNLRYSTGVSFEWISPLGPLAFSIAKPLNAKEGDQSQFFQFTIGGTF